jgi:ribosomal protein L13
MEQNFPGFCEFSMGITCQFSVELCYNGFMGNETLKMKDMLIAREHRYHFIDCKEHTESYGRFLTKAAEVLQGKYSLHRMKNLATKDFLVIVNGKSVKISPNRHFYKHSGYVGGLTKHNHKEVLSRGGKEARYIFKRSLGNMLPGRSQKHTQLQQVKYYDDLPEKFLDFKSKTAAEQQKILRGCWRDN